MPCLSSDCLFGFRRVSCVDKNSTKIDKLDKFDKWHLSQDFSRDKSIYPGISPGTNRYPRDSPGDKFDKKSTNATNAFFGKKWGGASGFVGVALGALRGFGRTGIIPDDVIFSKLFFVSSFLLFILLLLLMVVFALGMKIIRGNSFLCSQVDWIRNSKCPNERPIGKTDHPHWVFPMTNGQRIHFPSQD